MRAFHLRAQTKTSKLCIAPYATLPGGINPRLSKSLFQPL